MGKFLSQRWRISRRHVVRGLGAALALPLLNAMQPTRAEAKSTSESGGKPRRSVFVYFPNGVNVYTWRIEKAGRDYELSVPLKPLERHRANITPISGLHHPNALQQQHVCADSWLTGAPLTNGFSSDKYKNTVSVDQLMAEKTAAHTRFPSLELSLSAGVGAPYNSTTLSFSGDGAPLPAESDPKLVFNRLFGTDSDGLDVQRARLARRRSVLDSVLTNARSFRQRLGQEDTARLDEYLSSVRDVEKRVERLNEWLDKPKPVVDGAPFQRNITKEQAGDYYRMMYDLIVLALRTDSTRVVTYASGTEQYGLAIPELKISQTRHELSHHNEVEAVKETMTRSDTFLSEQFAYFLDRLSQVKEDDELLLDRTMVLYGSGMSYGHSHGNANLPLVLAGGKSLGLKHGSHIDFNLAKIGSYESTPGGSYVGLCFQPADTNARMSNLLLTMLQKMEVESEAFVDSLGPISELLG
jgi:Protein of unknown function (DUF1552)